MNAGLGNGGELGSLADVEAWDERWESYRLLRDVMEDELVLELVGDV